MNMQGPEVEGKDFFTKQTYIEAISEAHEVSPEEEISLMREALEEKGTLLSLSKEIVKIRAKKDLNKLIKETFSKLFYFYHCTIAIVNEDKKTFRAFLLDPDSRIKIHEKYQHLITQPIVLHNGFDDRVLNSDVPLIIDFDALGETDKIPWHVRIMRESGIMEVVGAALSMDQERFASIWFYSDRKNNFTQRDLWLIAGIATLISPAIANIIAGEQVEKKIREADALLFISDAIASVNNRNDLLDVFNKSLKKLFYFTHSMILTLSEDGQQLSPLILDPDSISRHDPDYQHIASGWLAVNDEFLDRILSSKDPFIFDVLAEAGKEGSPDCLQLNLRTGVKQIMCVTLRRSDQQPLGILALYNDTINGFSENYRALIKGISYHLSTAISKILYLEDISRRDEENRILLEISNELVAVKEKNDILKIISVSLKKYFNYTDSHIVIYNTSARTYKTYIFHARDQVLESQEFQAMIRTEIPENEEIIDYSHQPIIVNVDDLVDSEFQWGQQIHQMGISEYIRVKLTDGDQIIGLFMLLSEQKNAFAQSKSLLQKISFQFSKAIANLIANEKIASQLEQINRYKQQLEEEKLYLQQEVSAGLTYDDIVGFGTEMQKVFGLLSQVSFANSTVLILGETGTGKELVARALHNSSSRKNKLMVKVNCAALPANLIESELFGHEKGSFTGATERRIGKFELANHGTLFLDEIGEMPLDLQVKLLRAIQEKEIERVGGTAVIKTDVRIIAATNRNLQQEVEAGWFRRDLYYRINVFPITLPPLRDRKDDIPALAAHFIKKYARNTGKKITSISAGAMQQLMAYNWPGNVRELEHLIERSVLMNSNGILRQMHLPDIASQQKDYSASLHIKTYQENERDYIIDILNRCDGRIYGRGGAAELLDLNISTLNSKIKKLGIRKGKTRYKK
ncbi:sigma-54-dependent Fis family transcriptional regulator [Dyadobacter psychrotolerans]|uniref:AAA family ATPase n=1 Tax=Dyadobacter psychrotolerans TaxID=2541721 RepID=A0A4R5DCQ4_9BACT|nr:sigma 54-interacting transcriptional regulator [Dyadobacter psychrotolerans]TDE10777.1 AAA family ATPase [Dyadobacter psychrotolerans]